jgi:hypothetical protein
LVAVSFGAAVAVADWEGEVGELPETFGVSVPEAPAEVAALAVSDGRFPPLLLPHARKMHERSITAVALVNTD